jgi:hypothetical protein
VLQVMGNLEGADSRQRTSGCRLCWLRGPATVDTDGVLYRRGIARAHVSRDDAPLWPTGCQYRSTDYQLSDRGTFGLPGAGDLETFTMHV